MISGDSTVAAALCFGCRALACSSARLISGATITKAIEALMHISTRDNEPKRSGRAIVVGLTPVQQNKRKLVHNETPGEEDGEDDSSVDNGENDAE